MTFPIRHLAKLFWIVFQHCLGPSLLKMRRKELIWDTLPFVQWTHRDVQTLMMPYIVLNCPMEIFRYLSFNSPPLVFCYSRVAFWRFFYKCFVAWFYNFVIFSGWRSHRWCFPFYSSWNRYRQRSCKQKHYGLPDWSTYWYGNSLTI